MASAKRARQVVAAAVSLMAVAGVIASLGAVPGSASSHREAPLITDDPKADTTDVYAFVSPDRPDTVTLIGSWIPFEEPAGGPNFYPFADNTAYDINIDNDGDARPDWVYRWIFSSRFLNKNTFLYNTGQVTSLTDPDLNFRQTYDLYKINGDTGNQVQLLNDKPVVPSRVGDASMPNYEALSNSGIHDFGVGAKSWAGQSDDAFFLDLRVFDLLYGANLSEVGDDTLAGFNVNTIALQVKAAHIAKAGNPTGNPVVGIWSTTSRRSTRVLNPNGTKSESGGWVQVSRLGSPLVNEVVIPVGHKDRFNASKPKDDGQFASFVTDPEVPKLIEAIYGIPAPATPRNDLVQAFLTGVPGLNRPANVQASEMLRLNMSIKPADCPAFNRLGVIDGDICGFPNGRRLADDVIDIALRVMEGDLLDGNPLSSSVALGDGVNANDRSFRSTFPYVALPWSGSDATVHTP